MGASRRSLMGDLGIAAGGILLIALTFRGYELPVALKGTPGRSKFSPAEADRRLLAAQSRLKNDPNDFNVWGQMAIAYFEKGPDSYVDALNALEKARSLGATSDEFFYYAGVMYDALGLPDYAAHELAKYFRRHPHDYEARARLANAYFHGRRYDEALELYQQAIRHRPKDSTVWFNYAIVSKEKGNLDEAQAALSQTKVLAGVLPVGGLFQEGEIARLKGSEEKAIALYQQELAAYPDFMPAWTALEAAQRRAKQWKEARNTRQRIEELKKAKPSHF